MTGAMVFDLRRTLLKKEEIETARLLDFEFCLRARTMRLFATELGMDPDAMVTRIAEHDDAAILDALVGETGRPIAALETIFAACRASSRAQLILERGDPAPHRLG